MAEWLPIDEDTPNDEDILVAYDDGSVEFVEGEENDYDWKPYEGRAPVRGIIRPTHWMPLPEPPAPPQDDR